MYAEGEEVELNGYCEYIENLDLYKRALAEEYIMLKVSFEGYPVMTVLRHPVPYLSNEDIISYFN
jgi:hypothetical protein